MKFDWIPPSLKLDASDSSRGSCVIHELIIERSGADEA
jgi:hypothetical protein